jgi:hypothetical protein
MQLCRCDGAKQDRRQEDPDVRFDPEVAMAMGLWRGDNTRRLASPPCERARRVRSIAARYPSMETQSWMI